MNLKNHMEACFETIHCNINIHDRYSQATVYSQVAGPMYAKQHSVELLQKMYETLRVCAQQGQ